jgi:hypothetical protein
MKCGHIVICMCYTCMFLLFADFSFSILSCYQGRHSRVIGPCAKESTGAPTYATTHMNNCKYQLNYTYIYGIGTSNKTSVQALTHIPYRTYIYKHWAHMLRGHPGNCPVCPCTKTALGVT